MNVEERGLLLIVTELPAGEACGSLDHVAPVAQMQAIDAVLRFYFGAADWLTVRNRRMKMAVVDPDAS